MHRKQVIRPSGAGELVIPGFQFEIRWNRGRSASYEYVKIELKEDDPFWRDKSCGYITARTNNDG
eukprot:5434491-Pyramimonas_sp.AAC.1